VRVIAEDLVAKLDTAITNKDAWPGDQFPDLVPTLAAKAATRSIPLIGHTESIGG
jgi:hypothetical protein